MKKFLCTVTSACLIFLVGCGQSGMVTNLSFQHQNDVADMAVTTVSFVSGMGCSDMDCADASHHHDCPPDCGDYEHHHNCGLDCTEVSHHHVGMEHGEEHHADLAEVAAISFVSGMGCSDPNCTGASHHHDCPPDCGDYEHHHNCGLDCTEVSHHHAGMEHKEEHHTDLAEVVAISFVSGMGCSDLNCTDASHHHDCPLDCGDYEHHHNCGLDCTEISHHHSSASTVNESGQHHREQHHGSNHH